MWRERIGTSVADRWWVVPLRTCPFARVRPRSAGCGLSWAERAAAIKPSRSSERSAAASPKPTPVGSSSVGLDTSSNDTLHNSAAPRC